ncbi:MAG: lipocalin-like domain-containing protein [Chloroflexota bacterium]
MHTAVRRAALAVPILIALAVGSGGGSSIAAAAPAALGQPTGPDTTSAAVMVDPNANLRPTAGSENDSWYDVLHIAAGGHQYGAVFHYLQLNTASMSVSDVSLVDETTGWYTSSELRLAAGEGLSDTGGVNIHTDNMTWTGDATAMQVQAVFPEGVLNLTTRPTGPVLYNMGTGYFPLFDGNHYPQYEYAFPTMTTTGTLTLNGQTDQVTGQTWFDRQSGPQPASLSKGQASWTWMDLNLSMATDLVVRPGSSGPGVRRQSVRHEVTRG